MAPKAADCKNVHNPNLQCKNDFLPYFDSFFLSLLKVYDHKIIFSWPLCIFGSKITKKNVSLIFYPKIPNPPPLRPLWGGGVYEPPFLADVICEQPLIRLHCITSTAAASPDDGEVQPQVRVSLSESPQNRR